MASLVTGRSFIMKRNDNIKPDKCLTTLPGDKVGVWNCVEGHPAQTWYLESDRTLRHADPGYANKCVQVNMDNSISLAPCGPNSTKFTYANNRLTINGTNPQRCINLSGRNYNNGTFVDSFVCDSAQPDTVTWIANPPVVAPVVNRDSTASDCRINDPGLTKLFQDIDKCTSSSELSRNNVFGGNIMNITQDIKDLQANITDSLSKGDLLFGAQPHNQITEQVTERNKELKSKKEKLSKDIVSKEAIIERSDQDFRDVKQTISEPEPKKILRFIEDYSVAFLLLSYIFMVLSGMYWYTLDATVQTTAWIQAIVGGGVLSAFFFMILLHIS